jgi:hypothetical protein
MEEEIMANRDGRKRQGKTILEKRRQKREKQATNTIRIRKGALSRTNSS